MTIDPSAAPELDEHLRMPAPAPAPQALACDGDRLWISSWETGRLYQIDAHQGTLVDEAESPGRPVGGVVTGDEIRFVVSEADDDRFIRRFIPGHGFKSEATPCPGGSGSFLAFDGECLWLTQRFNKSVLELSADHAVVRTIGLDAEILGATWADGELTLSLWYGARTGGCAIARLDPRAAEPAARVVARSRFAAISLGFDGTRYWTNDSRKNEIVAFAIGAGAAPLVS